MPKKKKAKKRRENMWWRKEELSNIVEGERALAEKREVERRRRKGKK